MKIMRLAIYVLVSVYAAVVASADDVPNQAVAVDLTPAVRIGDFTTSRYLFEKAYNQFIASSTRRARQKPSKEEVEHWFLLYLAQLVVKADLVGQKQLEVPEIVKTTEQMARYMLTQPRGPLYLALGGADLIAFRRERRVLILQECRVSAHPENIVQLWTAIAPQLRRGAPLRETDVEPISSSILASYFSKGVAKQISALDFVRDFQQGIARVSPRDVKSLSDEIEDIVIAEYDLAEARKLRLDQTPQFLEDRHNFALNQALALYEQKLLSTQITISPGELVTYYRTNIQRYGSPMEVSGVLRIFSDLESARRGLSSALSGTDHGLMFAPPEVIDPFVIRRDGPPLSADVPYQFLASAPTDQSYGPFARDGKYVIFLKRVTGEHAPMPLERIQEQARRELSRKKLDALELECLSQNLDAIQLFLDFAKYNIENPFPRLRTERVTPPPLRVGADGKNPMPN